MPHPSVYIITGAIALGVALYALFASQPTPNKQHSYNSYRDRESTPQAFYREECSICKDLLCFPTVALECGHVFHSDCIRQSIRLSSKKCPNCRNPISRTLLSSI